MSLRVIVADDQQIIREHICKFVTETDSVFEIAGSFEDGRDVIDYLKDNHVDIILTDVLMCEVSGIDVAKYVYENKLSTHVVIISAYRDFEYARSALSYGVKDYLIKPTSTKELRKVLEGLKDEMMDVKKEVPAFSLLEECIMSGDITSLADKSEEIIQSILSVNPKSENYRTYILEILQLLDKRFSQLDIDTSAIKKIKSEYINTVWNYNDESIRKWAEDKTRKIFVSLNEKDDDKNAAVVRKATEFIKEHYMENISITDVASRVYLNEDYFGKLLKKNLNKSFSDYITEIRMEEAIRLLRTGKYKIYQIGEKVGYKSSNYFIKSFKSYTGYTPGDYCQKFGVDNEE